MLKPDAQTCDELELVTAFAGRTSQLGGLAEAFEPPHPDIRRQARAGARIVSAD